MSLSVDEIERTMNTYHTAWLVCMIAACVFLVAAVVLFIVFRIPRVFMNLTGIERKRQIKEITENVKRLRHHASLGLWCGNNEMESAWDHWPEVQSESKYLRADYIKMFEYVVPKAVKAAPSSTPARHIRSIPAAERLDRAFGTAPRARGSAGGPAR